MGEKHMPKNKSVFTRERRIVSKATLEVPGPVESWDPDEPWAWPDWPKGPVGASQTGGKGIKKLRSAADEGLNPFRYSFQTGRMLLQKMRDPPPEGIGAPVHPKKYPVKDEGDMTRNIKATAHYLGADLVGIAKLSPERINLGVIRKEQEYVARFTHFIALAVEFDAFRYRTRLIHPNFSRPVRAPAAGADPIKGYFDLEGMCAHLSSYIRGLGYNTESQGSGRRVLNGPFANWAGLGETGRCNLVITPEFGPRIHLGGILTDLPMAEDHPIDFGVQAFCESCKKCVRSCPAGAFTDGPKQLVRGVYKWPFNRKLCSEIGRSSGGPVDYGCQQCQVVCPYSGTPDFIDYNEREQGENAVLGMWTELWDQRGRTDNYVPPP
jgi:ferredoxin